MNKQYLTKKKIIVLKDISKQFSGITVLDNINFELYQGELLGIVGENGAGKSTLIKILSGAFTPTKGNIIINGVEHNQLNPSEASKFGIHAIYQENILVPSMSVIENIFLGTEIKRNFIFVNEKESLSKTKELLDFFDINLNPYSLIKNLNVAQQQYVKILKALVNKSTILIMDEPTTMFNENEISKIFNVIERIKSQGVSIIYISHSLKEIVKISDRIMVLRDGRMINIYNNPNKNLNISILMNDMVGRPIEEFYKRKRHILGEVVFKVENLLYKKSKHPISISVKRGEILGLTGMVGAGRTELVRSIFGADRKISGNIWLEGKYIKINNPIDAIKQGIALINEDRQKMGLCLIMDIIENIAMVDIGLKKQKWFSKRAYWHSIKDLYTRMRIKASSPYAKLKELSGGNQQKVVLSKWLVVNSKLIIFDEPTKGIDINAKSEIYDIITQLASEGKAIILVSSDMPEIITLSDRVLVMKKNMLVAELLKEEINERTILAKAIGV